MIRNLSLFVIPFVLSVASGLAQPAPKPVLPPAPPPDGLEVYVGCATPSAPSAGAHTWWIDPVKGKTLAAGGLGTEASPWDSLAALTGAKGSNGVYGPIAGYTGPLLSSVNEGKGGGTGPIHPGDTILLMSGNYGAFSVGDYNAPVLNTDWITVKAAPDQTPVLSTLSIARTSKWVFQGIKVQSLQGPKDSLALITVTDQGAAFPTSDIIFSDMDLSSFDAIPVGFTQAEWETKARSGYRVYGSPGNGTNGVPYTSCISMSNSKISNVTFGAVTMGNNELFDHNEIDHFGDDGLEYAANNLAITHNKETNGFGTANGIHTDGMQGQIGPIAKGVAFNKFSNIVIDSNIIIRQTDPNLAYQQYLQGIDAFDSDWTNMTITNNVIVTSACWGIDMASIHDSLIAGNTVLEDNGITMPGCTVMLAAGGVTHENLAGSTNVRVTNNLAERYGVGSKGDVNVTFDHNVALMASGFAYWNTAAKPPSQVYYNKPAGTDANGNVSTSVSTPYANVFTTWDLTTHDFDLRPKLGSIAMGKGNGIPTTNILGETRIAPFSVGAY